MTILPLDPAANRTPEALNGFLASCRTAAAKAGRPQLVSISLPVDSLDPLAVLESIFEPNERHFYVERPAEQTAIAGAEAVIAFSSSGSNRFSECQRFIDDTLANTIAVGDLMLAFAGPHFFTTFAFFDQVEAGEPFDAATVFVPRWQVALQGNHTVAVANLLVAPDSPIDAMTEKVWRAHAKFGAFDYAAPDFTADAVKTATLSDVGVPDTYPRAVKRALSEITAGAIEKIVLARAKNLTARQKLHPLRVLNGLRQRFSDCYAFSVANGRGQSFIGASPERLLRVKDRQLVTEALAGSIQRGTTASEDAGFASVLLRDDKEIREHRLVLDSIISRLKSLGVEPEYSDRPGIRRYANVQHLHTPVMAGLPGHVRVLDVVASLHPTPAVGGAPREAAVSRISALEEFPRGLYAGALGWIDARGGGEFFVGLRSALIDGSRARLYAGSGIVEGSSPEREFAETELKFRAMQEALLS